MLISPPIKSNLSLLSLLCQSVRVTSVFLFVFSKLTAICSQCAYVTFVRGQGCRKQTLCFRVRVREWLRAPFAAVNKGCSARQQPTCFPPLCRRAYQRRPWNFRVVISLAPPRQACLPLGSEMRRGQDLPEHNKQQSPSAQSVLWAALGR